MFRKNVLKFSIPLLAIFMIASFIYLQEGHSIPLKRKPTGGDFILQSTQGPRSLKDFQSKTVLMFFGFTRCPQVCPTTLSDLERLLTLLSPSEKKSLQILFVSLDTERDSVDYAQKYADRFDKSIVSLTGTPEQLKKVAESYGAFFRKVPIDSAMKYTIDHTSQIFVISKSGQWVSTLNYATPPEEIKRSILPLLTEK